MLGVAAIALFLSTLHRLRARRRPRHSRRAGHQRGAGHPRRRRCGASPYLPTNYWLAWIDLFRQPILWYNVQRGLAIQAVYALVFLGAAWANFSTKDVTG